MSKSREREHRAFFTWLLTTIEQQSVDTLVVAGDIFDTATPPSYARKLYLQLMVQLEQSTVSNVVFIGGNHDSVAVLHESRELLACLNIHVVGGVLSSPEEQVITLSDRDQQPIGLLCAVPFIRPRDVLLAHSGESAEHKKQALMTAIAAHYESLFSVAQQRQAEWREQGVALPIIATGHLTVMGVQLSESVREIYIGSLEAFPAKLLPEADYIALGHIHRAQKVAKTEHIRYSGSPIPLSFDELNAQKVVHLAAFDEDRLGSVVSLPIPCFQPMAALSGDLQALQTSIDALDLADLVQGQNYWLEVEVCDEEYLADLPQRLEQMIDGRAIEVLRTKRRRQFQPSLSASEGQSLNELSVYEVFDRRLAEESLDDALSGELKMLYRQLVSELHDEQQGETR